MTMLGTLRLSVSAFAGGLLCICVVNAGPISFDTFTRLTGTGAQAVVDNFPSGVTGVGYLGNGNFVVSMQGAGPVSTLMFTSNGTTQAPFGPSNLSFIDQNGGTTGEHRIAISQGMGGFPSGNVYVADANTIDHFNGQGSLVGTIILPPLQSGVKETVRNMLFDSTGSFGNLMLVSTDQGNIYTIDSAGHVTHLATLPAALQPRSTADERDAEAMDIAPVGVFGPFQGQLIVALHEGGTSPQNATNGMYAVAPNGTITQLPVTGNGGVFNAESLSFVPNSTGSSLDGYYVALYPFQILKTGASALSDFTGDALIFSEGPPGSPGLYRLHWNGSSFDAPSPIGIKLPSSVADNPPCQNPACSGGMGLTEQALFISIPTPEPATFLLCGACLLAGVFWRRSSLRIGRR